MLVVCLIVLQHTTPTKEVRKRAQTMSSTIPNRRSKVQVDGLVPTRTSLPGPIHGAIEVVVAMVDGDVEIEDSYTNPVKGAQTLGRCQIERG